MGPYILYVFSNMHMFSGSMVVMFGAKFKQLILYTIALNDLSFKSNRV